MYPEFRGTDRLFDLRRDAVGVPSPSEGGVVWMVFYRGIGVERLEVGCLESQKHDQSYPVQYRMSAKGQTGQKFIREALKSRG